MLMFLDDSGGAKTDNNTPKKKKTGLWFLIITFIILIPLGLGAAYYFCMKFPKIENESISLDQTRYLLDQDEWSDVYE